MVFGKSKFDKQQDAWIKQLWANQQVLIKNNEWFIKQIRSLHATNASQDAFDKQVIATIESLKNHTHIELSKAIQDLQKAVAQLQQVSHTQKQQNRLNETFHGAFWCRMVQIRQIERRIKVLELLRQGKNLKI
jgi:hypothetical protein